MATNIHPACQPVSGEFNVLDIKVEGAEAEFHARLRINLKMPWTRQVDLQGPARKSKPEAVKDGIELGKRFVIEGEAGAKTLLLRLRKKRWTSREVQDVDETALDKFSKACVQERPEPLPLRKKLLPPGEGWTRHSEDMLVHSKSQVYFVQSGDRAGQFLWRASACDRSEPGEWEDAEPPHCPQDYPILVRAATASSVRRGGKMDRAVLLNDITKIARLALKMPLSFVDKPACACALFQGLRSSESAQWCAENFHKKLLPRLAEKIHEYESSQLEYILRLTLEDLDGELLRSPHAFSGCSALVALLLGDRLIAGGVGDVRALLLPEKGEPRPLLACSGNLDSEAECKRIREAGGVVKDGSVFDGNRSEGAAAESESLSDATRILEASNVFDIIFPGLHPVPLEEKEVRSAYRRFALRVHPDKQSGGGDSVDVFKSAFARLERAKEALEAMLSASAECCRDLCRVLRSEVHTREGAAGLLGVDKTASMDTEHVTQEAEAAATALLQKLAPLQQVAPDYDQAVSVCQEAVETLRRGCALEALSRYESLMQEGVASGRALGLRDLRRPRPIVAMEIETASMRVPMGTGFRLGLLCGATSRIPDGLLASAGAAATPFTSVPIGAAVRAGAASAAAPAGRVAWRRPKTSALRWCLDADAAASCSSAICVSLGPSGEQGAPPPAKKARAATGAAVDGCLRIRHILWRHQQLRQADPTARREGAARTAQEAEEAALGTLEALLRDPSAFPRLCREHSDCQSAEQSGMLTGDLGWIGKGQLEQVLEVAAFSLAVSDFSDLISSSRGVHILQRLA